MAQPGLAASHQSQALWDKPGIKKMFGDSLGNPFPDTKYNATSQYGMAGDIGNWVNNKMHGGPQTQVERSRAMNTLVTGKPTVTSLADRGVDVPARYGDVGLKPIDPSKVETYKGLPGFEKITTPVFKGASKGGSKGGSKSGSATTATATMASPTGSAPDYSALDSAQVAQDMKLGYAAPSAAVPQVVNAATVVPSLANPSTAENNIWMNPDQTEANNALAKFGTENPAGTNWDMGDIAKGVEAASGLANAYLGYKNYGLAKDQFGFTKAMANRNIANQASEYNTGLQNAGEVGMSLAGNTMDPAARAARQAQLDAQKISGAPIG